MKNTLLFFLLLFFGNAYANEKVELDIFLFGNKVGEITATREKRTDGTDYYHLTTKARAKVLWIMRNQSSVYNVYYKDGKMLSSEFSSRDNDDKEHCKVLREADAVTAVNHKGEKNVYKDIPVFSIVSLYFREPKNIDRFFDETEGVYLKIKETKPGEYEFKRRNGDRSIYRYVNGVLDNVEFYTSIVSVKVKRR